MATGAVAVGDHARLDGPVTPVDGTSVSVIAASISERRRHFDYRPPRRNRVSPVFDPRGGCMGSRLLSGELDDRSGMAYGRLEPEVRDHNYSLSMRGRIVVGYFETT